MSLFQAALASLCLAALASSAAALSGQVSCHFKEDPTFRKAMLGDGVECKSVTIPFGFCAACPLKPVNLDDGTFPDCESVYDLSSKACQRKLRRYSRMNPCDTQRSEQVQNFDFRNTKKLDYFVYALCEGCCDCIALDTEASDAGQMDLNRYNCPDHGKADICKVLPKVGHYRLPRNPPAPADEDIPDICGTDLVEWKESDGRRRVGFTVFEPPVEKWLKGAVKSLQCAKSSVWSPCFELENSQGRLDSTPDDE